MAVIVSYTDYITIEGDMFDIIALKFYSEESFAHHIMQANPEYISTIVFEGGITLKIPVFDTLETSESLPPWL